MNSLLVSLKQFIERMKVMSLEMVKRIEESALFEKLVSDYDGLELRQQKWIQASFVLALLTMLLLVFTWPLVSVFNERTALTSTRELINEMRAFQEQISVIRKPAPRPVGFQPLPAGNASEFEDSFKAFMASIGIDGDLLEFTSTGTGTWSLSIPELSIRQALAITFQLDGWFPAVRLEKVKLMVNADNKQLLTLESNIRFFEGMGAAPPQNLPVASGNGGRANANPRGGGGAPTGAKGGAGANRPGTPGSTANSGNEDWGDLPPPNTEDDF